MRRAVLTAAIVVASLAALLSGRTDACSCIQLSKTEYGRQAAAVFTGTVTATGSAIPFVGSCSSTDPVSVVFEVDAVYKGDVTRPMTVMTVRGGASCGYDFVVGKRYTVFPWRLDGKLDAGLCRGNVKGPIDHAEYGLPAAHPPAP